MGLTLITGGARSGKSHFAEQLAAAGGPSVWFVATAEARDEDMTARIARHRAERPATWHTLEEPRHLAHALAHLSAQHPPADVVVLDCVTLWVTNLLLHPETTWDTAWAELEALLAWSAEQPPGTTLLVVTNEVGLGIVPADALSRTFRDWLGRFNQRLAAEAESVYLLLSGLPIDVKRLAVGR